MTIMIQIGIALIAVAAAACAGLIVGEVRQIRREYRRGLR